MKSVFIRSGVIFEAVFRICAALRSFAAGKDKEMKRDSTRLEKVCRAPRVPVRLQGAPRLRAVAAARKK